MSDYIAAALALAFIAFLYVRQSRRWRREWEAYLVLEREWMTRVKSGEFGDDCRAMNAAHPRHR